MRISPRSAFCPVVNLHKFEELLSSNGDRNELAARRPRNSTKGSVEQAGTPSRG